MIMLRQKGTFSKYVNSFIWNPKLPLILVLGLHWLNSSSANLFAVRLLVAFGKWLYHFKAFKENQTPLNIPLWKCFLSIQVCRTDIIIQRKQNSYYCSLTPKMASGIPIPRSFLCLLWWKKSRTF